ncbi:MAG: hypothetical protein WCK49_02810 [Myxococcaceae bacterium]
MLTQNMQGYFQEALGEALRRSKSSISEEVHVYLIYLLTDFARSERVYAGVNPGEEPILVLLLERALESPPAEANRIFKHIGDSTLYLSGFFGERTQTSRVNHSYYMAMGENAYFRLAQNTRVPVYHELSGAFERLVFLLRQVSLHDRKPSPEEILSWIEQYQQSKSPELQTLLAINGVFLKNDDPTC